ncbi:hypothetical protein A2Y83_04955 [Candidatus Falkowbacteria bacterium RBG_13_39_14]|uniref:Uncharacterized protein n=1 Tax=Candidatus Falkowbacteria bacterium RBG_13_39_14 TaxID=1797985 RepID=A0A1F5S1J6_9BACT|nr:MAG: hypothetical protein A2Y83_04955 [Candidatus Falkowbacteria bacterium RBG_13_39_14]
MAPKPVNTREGSPLTSDRNKKLRAARKIMPLESAIISMFMGGSSSPNGASITTKTLKSPT